MFEKKDQNLKIEKDVTVNTIPEEFYGGKDPVVTFKNVTTEIDLKDKSTVLTEAEKQAFYKKTAVGGEEKGVFFIKLFTSPKYLAIFAGIIFLLSILGVGGYYYLKNYNTNKQIDIFITQEPVLETPVITTTTVLEDNSVQEEVLEQEEENVSSPENLVLDLPLEFPSILLAESADLDDDGLTDLAEEEFQTDPGSFDTDGDGYPDGLEVFYLYNPKGFEPQRLIDSNLVKVYENFNFSYRVYIPINWAIGSVDQEERQVLFSTLSGENIEVRVFDLRQDEDFSDWFVRVASDQDDADLVDIETRGGFLGKARNDNLVYYFVYNGKVYVFLYHTTEFMVVNYKSVLSLMIRSLDFEVDKPQNLEDQVILVEPLVQSPEEQDIQVEATTTEEVELNEEVI